MARYTVAMTAALLAACGGGGGNDGAAAPVGDAVQRRTAASDPLAHRCAVPRRGNDPYNGNRPYPDTAGTLDQEKQWLATFMNEVYLWYREIPAVIPSTFTAAGYGSNAAAMEAYFEALLTPARTDSGKLKDAYSFVYPTAEWRALSRAGESVSYGMDLVMVRSNTPREVLVALVDAGTSAATASIARGMRLLAVDGVSMVNGYGSALSAGLYPQTAGESHRFTFENYDGSGDREVTLTAQRVVSDPVPTVRSFDTPTGRVGYLLFNEHVATSEGRLVDAINQLSAQNITDLVLDLRYNGGGYLDIASELAYMIAGSAITNGKIFERQQFNDKNPLGNQPSASRPFQSRSLGFDPSLPRNTALPALNLGKLYLIAGPGTCSASEALINGLRGVDVEVVIVGGTTCGKPYGFYGTDNCGTSYFAIEFAGVNQKGFGDYADGMAATCSVADDYTRELGDVSEARLAAALSHRQTGSCAVTAKAFEPASETMLRSPLHENAWRQLP